mmetsp:Transcript_8202/g.27217  ORF Transcript_8202/g.27217 Transcript_8202/m.27217 type:complete len:221 (+) Transcript_8202:1764-2426(+)
MVTRRRRKTPRRNIQLELVQTVQQRRLSLQARRHVVRERAIRGAQRLPQRRQRTLHRIHTRRHRVIRILILSVRIAFDHDRIRAYARASVRANRHRAPVAILNLHDIRASLLHQRPRRRVRAARPRRRHARDAREHRQRLQRRRRRRRRARRRRERRASVIRTHHGRGPRRGFRSFDRCRLRAACDGGAGDRMRGRSDARARSGRAMRRRRCQEWYHFVD